MGLFLLRHGELLTMDAACPRCGSLMTASTPCDPDTVPEVLVDLVDISEFDETPTVNILRPGPRTEPGLANVDPDIQRGSDADVISSAPRVEDPRAICRGRARRAGQP